MELKKTATTTNNVQRVNVMSPVAPSPSPHPEEYPKLDEDTRQLHPIQKYVMGDIVLLNEWLRDKPAIVQSWNWFLRAVGAPIFLNNPISGVLLLVAMFVGNPWGATCGVLGLLSAIITAVLLKQDRGAIEGGGVTFHGMLVGITLAASLDKPPWYPWVLFPVLLMAIVR